MSTSPATAAPTSAPSAPAYRVLARTYRPQTLPDLIGQDVLVRTLTNALHSGRVHHAFLLMGIRGVGKTTTARILARAFNCIGPDGTGGPTPEPCGVCEHCRMISEDRHMDVMEMDAASRTGVGDIRELIDTVPYLPISARTKVYIIDEVHMLSTSAFNALLKTLEEPPPHVKFIFATTELRKVPVTIISRCQRFDLRRVDAATLSAHLRRITEKEQVQADDDALAMIASAGEGSVRDSLSLLDQAIAHGDGRVTTAVVQEMLGVADILRVLRFLEVLFAGDITAALEQFAEAYGLGVDPLQFMHELLEMVHFLTQLKLRPMLANDATVPETQRQQGAALAGQLSLPVLGMAWQLLLHGAGEVKTAPRPRQAAEMTFIRLAHLRDLPDPGMGERGGNGTVTSASVNSGQATGSGQAMGPRAAASSGVHAVAAAPRAMQAMQGGNAQAAQAMASPAPQAEPQPHAAPALPQPRTLEDIAELLKARGEPLLAHTLRQHVRPVRMEPGKLTVHIAPGAVPVDFAGRVSTLLTQWTGTRWVVMVTQEPGGATLAEHALSARTASITAAASQPLVAAVMDAFPGAAITAIVE